MRKFKKYRGIRLPYEKQGMIFFTCRNYTRLAPKLQKEIWDLCRKCCRENADALFVMLTTDKPIQQILMDYKIASETTLYNARKRFYESWEKEHGKK